ncbi:polysaccharide biosynthesis C-terminal domain-containing protein [Enterococcus sp. ALS3]|uniref:Polysaccharide biosynthesis C-terminal domain-containing protein n=1 Tax=Enterococcus alishanensis TaxID=1303817 RepID=A0ABS6TE41_9ENTE|nr:polysaccharide biosynthesis C-terminal domain-containing protein [Enterococcus alishanensis]MBV7391189.1 polysaccharide biosynthesis C-terminal domain-containing protein [Enterococcus alishanensis]
MNQYKKLFNDSLIFAIGSFGSKLITFFLVGFYTYYLTKAQYGTADLLINTINLLLPIVSLSVSEGVLRFVLDSKSKKEQMSWLSVALRINLIGLAFSGVLLLIVYLFGLHWTISSSIGLLSFVLLTIQSFQLILMQYIKAVGKLKIYAANGIILSLLTLLFGILFFRQINNKLVAYFLSLVVANSFSLIFLVLNISWKDMFFKKSASSFQSKQIIKYSLPLIPNSAMWWILTTSSRFIMTFFLGVASNGMYAAASKIPNLLSVLGAIFMQAWQLSAVEQYHKKDAGLFFQKVFNHYSTFLLFSSGMILLFLDPLAAVLLSKEFYFAKAYIPLLLISNFFSCISGFFGTTYIVVKKTKGILTTSLIGAAVNLVGSLSLIPLIGINGASLASSLGFFIIFYLRKRQTNHLMDSQLTTGTMFLQLGLLIVQIMLKQWGGFSKIFLFTSQGLVIFLIVLIGLYRSNSGQKGALK